MEFERWGGGGLNWCSIIGQPPKMAGVGGGGGLRVWPDVVVWVKHGSNWGHTWVKYPRSLWWVAGSWTFLDLVVKLEEWSVCLTFNMIFLPLLYIFLNLLHIGNNFSINLGFIPWIIRCRHTSWVKNDLTEQLFYICPYLLN